MKYNRLLASSAIALTATVGLSAIAEAGNIRHDRSDSQYRSLANLFPSVGRLDITSGTSGWLCSGTLINSTWLLTAAHCAESNGQLMTRGSFNIGGSSYSITQGVMYGGWLSSNRNLGLGVDLALMRLNRAVTNITPSSLFTSFNEDLQTGTYVGFGRTGNGLTGFTGSAGTKRAGQNIIGLGSRLNVSNNVLVSDFDDPRFADSHFLSQPLNLEYQLGPGDSGGGLFIGGRLAGVNSFISSTDGRTDGDYGDTSAAVRVSSYSNWIQNVMRGWTSSSSPSARISSPTPSSPSPIARAQAEVPISELMGDFSNEIAFYDDIWDHSPADVPEPSALLGIAAIGGLLRGLRRRPA